MTSATFSSRLANMESALERACLLLPSGSEKHSTRTIIASKIIECAIRGDTKLSSLTEAGYSAAMQLIDSGQLLVKKEEAPTEASLTAQQLRSIAPRSSATGR
jgi:hypothetical protein